MPRIATKRVQFRLKVRQDETVLFSDMTYLQLVGCSNASGFKGSAHCKRSDVLWSAGIANNLRLGK